MRGTFAAGLFFFGLAALVVLSAQSSSQGRDDRVFDPSAPPLGLGLGNVPESEVMKRIVDRSEGHVAVDPFAGPHPLDVFFLGDPSGVLPVCRALE